MGLTSHLFCCLAGQAEKAAAEQAKKAAEDAHKAAEEKAKVSKYMCWKSGDKQGVRS